MKLKDLLEIQHPGVRSDPYKYKIVDINEIYNHANDEKKVKDITHIFLNIEDIPEQYLEYKVYQIEPTKDKNGCLYLCIVIY